MGLPAWKGPSLTEAYINAIGTAVPGNDIHTAFTAWATERLPEHERRLFARMAARSGIEHRWSVLPPGTDGASPAGPCGFYGDTPLPATGARMAVYASAAPELALEACRALADQTALDGITHLVVASCTGFVAPGVDQILAGRLGLGPGLERLLVGFMGCYAAVAALRSARHIVRSDASARVLVVTVELSSLHLRETGNVEEYLAMLQFGDGAAAALVSADPAGLAIDRPFSTTLPASAALIQWTIGDAGFEMVLSGEVPGRIAEALADEELCLTLTGGLAPAEIDGWAVHAGGRSILDAVERGLGLKADALGASRGVLADNGNMSSATLMFVLARMLAGLPVAKGVALAFGPGLAAEGFGFRHAP